MIGPLAALLLVAGELNVLGWDVRGGMDGAAIRRRRCTAARLGALGLAATAEVGAITLLPSPGGIAAAAEGAAALAALATLLFPR